MRQKALSVRQGRLVPCQSPAHHALSHRPGHYSAHRPRARRPQAHAKELGVMFNASMRTAHRSGREETPIQTSARS